MKNICNDCNFRHILSLWNVDSLLSSSESDSESNSDDEILFSMLIHENFKKVTKCFAQEFYNQWEQTVMELKEQIHRKRMQVDAYNACKANLKNCEAIIHTDYCESYKNKHTKMTFKVCISGSLYLVFLLLVFITSMMDL